MMNVYSSIKYKGSYIKICPGDCANSPRTRGRDKRPIKDCNTNIFVGLNRQGISDTMDLITQGEIFPSDSEFNSRNAVERKREKLTKSAKDINRKRGRPKEDLVGHRFGKLSVIGESSEKYKGKTVWVCLCDCGHQIMAITANLKRSTSPLTHCGCMGVDRGGLPKPGTRGLGGFNSGTPKKENKLAAFRHLLAVYRYNAARRGLRWLLTKKQFLEMTRGDCYFCGIGPVQVHELNGNTYVYNGVDRLDPSVGYSVDNCVPCCGQCNIAKSDVKEADFLKWIERVYRHKFLK